MFSRRYLRRSLVTALLLPIILLSLFIIYQNRYVIFSENLPHNHHHHHHDGDSHFSHNIIPNQNIRYHFTSTRVTTTTSSSSSVSSTVNINKRQQTKNASLILETFANTFNNNRLQQIFNPIQQIPSFQFHPTILPVIDTKNLERFVHL